LHYRYEANTMPNLAVFAKTYAPELLPQLLQSVRADGLAHVQFNLSCVGLPTLPATLDASVCDQIRTAHHHAGVTMVALSATGNIIHPDAILHQQVIDGIHTLIDAAPLLDCRLLTISTGTCHPDDMWASHPDNTTPHAWAAMCHSLRALLLHAEHIGVRLAFEPEAGNVVRTAAQARQLLDEIGSPALGIVLDVANLLGVDTIDTQHQVIDEALALLAPDIALVHLKELAPDGTSGHVAPGQGVIEYRYLRHMLDRSGVRVPQVMHGLPRAQVAPSVRWLNHVS
jgi:sugar phosphate isomerase/epimerase